MPGAFLRYCGSLTEKENNTLCLLGDKTRFFTENRRWQDAAVKLQNSQIKLDTLPSVDKTCVQIEQTWLSEFSPNESRVRTAMIRHIDQVTSMDLEYLFIPSPSGRLLKGNSFVLIMLW